MARENDALSPVARAAFDAIIDVRSPSEFAEDHIPGAINLPVLDDRERAEIGTLYVQVSKFLARRRGAALVARNIAAHLDGPLLDRPGGFRPLVYCWRGGQRSGAMTAVMDQIGWPVTRLDGGYRRWRRRVLDLLHDVATPLPHRLVLLDGPTGSGKTETLALLREHGIQSLDLEALAAHRGSLFGGTAPSQPPQKLFESRLAAALEALDPSQPVVVEAESSRIGARVVPARLWAAMKAAPRLALEASLEQRADYSLHAYADHAADPARLDSLLTRLPRRHGRGAIERWRAMAARSELAELTRDLLEVHYDPAYRGASARFGAPIAVLTAPVFAPDRTAAVTALAAAIRSA